MASSTSNLPHRERSPKSGELLARSLRALIVENGLTDGDHLATELEMMKQLNVGRAIMREALRILEAEGLIEVRRGSRLGPKVRLPGPEIVSRPVQLLLQISGATLADVHLARSGIEPLAASLLAVGGGQDAFDELDTLVTEDFPAAWQANDLGASTARFHLRLVELSGNAVLTMVARVIDDVTRTHAPHSSTALRLPRVRFDGLTASCRRLVELLRAGDGGAAEAYWRLHLESATTWSPEQLATVVVSHAPD